MPSPSSDSARRIAAEAGRLHGTAREDFLAVRCGSDSALRAGVEQVLRDQQQSQTLSGDGAGAPPAKPEPHGSPLSSHRDVHDARTIQPAASAGATVPPQEYAGSHARAADSHVTSSGIAGDGTAGGQRIGAYRVIRVLGEGGMGVVYLAQQERPRRIVALKVIRPGVLSPRMLRRFEHESQILGRLQHPGIAQVYEAGQYQRSGGGVEGVGGVGGGGDGGGDGGARNQPQPFFAMEYVEGVPLTQFALKLGVRERIELFCRVCDGVQHAHMKGVVHRDLKPGNILVQESESGSVHDTVTPGTRAGLGAYPKILDFGVARATDADLVGAGATMATAAGQLIGTVPYMSPEQIAGNADEVDSRSDVYTLGVILYELLSGSLPHKVEGKTLVEAARTIGFDEPPPLGSIDRAFRGDLQTIVGKALEKDKTRRYQSAAELASDLQRYLTDQPILARPPSTVYQLAKFTKRNKGVVIGAAATVLALIAGIFATAWQAVEATRGRTLAEDRRIVAERAQVEAREEADNARALSDFLTSMLASIDPETAQGHEVTVREVLDQAGRGLEKAMEGRPRIEASLQATIAKTYLSLARMEEAEAGARASLRLRQELALAGPDATEKKDTPETIEAMRLLSQVLADRGKLEEAAELTAAMTERSRLLHGENSVSYGMSLADSARILLEQGKLAESEQMFRRALEVVEVAPGREEEQINTIKHNISVALKDAGRFKEAAEVLEPVIAARRRTLGPDHPATLSSLNSLAANLQKAGESKRAVEMLGEVLASRRRVLGDEHVGTLTSVVNLGVTQVGIGDLDGAVASFREALVGLEKALGEEHPKTQIALNSLAYALEDKGQLDEAEKLFRRCVEIRRRTKGSRDQETWSPMNNLASLLHRVGKYEEAAALYEEVLAACRAALPPGHYYLAIFENNYGECLTSMKRYDDAEKLLVESLAALEKALGEAHPRVAKGKARLAALYDAWGKIEEARKWK